MNFKQDLTNYQGQQVQKPIGYSSGSQIDVSFMSDLQNYQQSTGPAQASLESTVNQQSAIKSAVGAKDEVDQKAEIEYQKMYYDHTKNAPEELSQTPNIEIDYAKTNLNTKPITAVPEGTVGGQCGVYAENIVKLPGGGNWAVGDKIEQKINSVARYANAGLGFYPDQEIPKPGNTVIIDPGTKWGHVAVVNSVNNDGTITLTESNWNWDGKVTHSRKIKLNDPSIIGYIRTQ